MRKITRQLVFLFAVFVIYFGYSAFVDGIAIFHLRSDIQIFNNLGESVGSFSSGLQIGSSDWAKTGINFVDGLFKLPEGWEFKLADGGSTTTDINAVINGFMAPNSLLYTLLVPFKLVLVGGVFAMLVPLTKSIFFGTMVGIKEYMKARRSNVLFNYQTTINFATAMSSKLETGDYEQIKAQYAIYPGLAFKPMFLKNMMDEIGDALIREMDMKPYIKPSQTVIVALKEMYEKERRAAISMKPDEMFFDFKRGYEYTSIGSKYCIAYYKALETSTNTRQKLAWKLFSLEMFRFYVYMLFSIIPTIILSSIVLPLVGTLSSSANANSVVAPLVIIVGFFGFAILFHAIFTLTKSSYRNMLKDIAVPAIVYYVLILILALTLALGIDGVQTIGQIFGPGTAVSKMWPFFSTVGYAILSTCLVMYIIATLMDSNKNPLGMTRKVIIDGVVLPSIAWLASTGLNFVGILAKLDLDIFSGISFAVLVGFWVYLSISGVLLNNIVIPSRKKKVEIQNTLAAEGKEAEKKSKDINDKK